MKPLSEMAFEELVTELEETARAMESADLGIERAAELYERAGSLHATALQRLTLVTARLEQLRNATPDRHA